VNLRHIQTMGGWSLGKATDLSYDHGLEEEQYRREQFRVAHWLRRKGYLGTDGPQASPKVNARRYSAAAGQPSAQGSEAGSEN
jgi:hypothetical protein